MVQSVAYFGGRVKGKNGFFLECGGRKTAIAGERNGAAGTERQGRRKAQRWTAGRSARQIFADNL